VQVIFMPRESDTDRSAPHTRQTGFSA
jgi:hypothetical protein